MHQVARQIEDRLDGFLRDGQGRSPSPYYREPMQGRSTPMRRSWVCQPETLIKIRAGHPEVDAAAWRALQDLVDGGEAVLQQTGLVFHGVRDGDLWSAVAKAKVIAFRSGRIRVSIRCEPPYLFGDYLTVSSRGR